MRGSPHFLWGLEYEVLHGLRWCHAPVVRGVCPYHHRSRRHDPRPAPSMRIDTSIRSFGSVMFTLSAGGCPIDSAVVEYGDRQREVFVCGGTSTFSVSIKHTYLWKGIASVTFRVHSGRRYSTATQQISVAEDGGPVVRSLSIDVPEGDSLVLPCRELIFDREGDPFQYQWTVFRSPRRGDPPRQRNGDQGYRRGLQRVRAPHGGLFVQDGRQRVTHRNAGDLDLHQPPGLHSGHSAGLHGGDVCRHPRSIARPEPSLQCRIRDHRWQARGAGPRDRHVHIGKTHFMAAAHRGVERFCQCRGRIELHGVQRFPIRRP